MNAVEVNNISKVYSLGVKKSNDFRNQLSKLSFKKADLNQFYALKNVSIDIKKGEVLGVIGNNGAGKSTLLKVLSRITRPSEGQITINGRVASLLEVGTGFHPELTGRENIFLNGTILGMTRKEVSDKFDEIVDFSGVSNFIDTPVKHYSSGMYVRLAFSVAAHLEPEILIIDEVLAVGDLEFQKKCLGKMNDIAGNGRTIIFVSHNMSAVKNLCDRAVYLNQGEIEYDGKVEDCIDFYINKNISQNELSLSENTFRKGIGEFIFSSFTFYCGSKKTDRFELGENIIIELLIDSKDGAIMHDLRVDLGLNNSKNERISWLSSSLHEKLTSFENKSSVKVQIEIESPNLVPGFYNFTLNLIANGKNQDWVPNVCKFEVLEAPFYKSGNFPPKNQGDFLLKHNFKVKNYE